MGKLTPLSYQVYKWANIPSVLSTIIAEYTSQPVEYKHDNYKIIYDDSTISCWYGDDNSKYIISNLEHDQIVKIFIKGVDIIVLSEKGYLYTVKFMNNSCKLVRYQKYWPRISDIAVIKFLYGQTVMLHLDRRIIYIYDKKLVRRFIVNHKIIKIFTTASWCPFVYLVNELGRFYCVFAGQLYRIYGATVDNINDIKDLTGYGHIKFSIGDRIYTHFSLKCMTVSR